MLYSNFLRFHLRPFFSSGNPPRTPRDAQLSHVSSGSRGGPRRGRAALIAPCRGWPTTGGAGLAPLPGVSAGTLRVVPPPAMPTRDQVQPTRVGGGSCFTSLRGRCPHRGLALLLSGRRVTPIYSPVPSFICLPWIHGCLFYTLNRCKIPHYYFSLLVQLSRR